MSLVHTPSDVAGVTGESTADTLSTSLLRCVTASLESMCCELGHVVRGLDGSGYEPHNLSGLAAALRDQANQLEMGGVFSLGWSQGVTSCRAAAMVVDGWARLTKGTPHMIHPETHEALDTAAAAFHRYLRSQWPHVLIKARSGASSTEDMRAA